MNNNNNFNYFKYKTKVLEYTVAQPALNQANGIFKNSTIAVSLRDLNNFGRPHEKPLINCKVELKLRWTKHYFYMCLLLHIYGNDDGANTSNIVFTIKDAKLFVHVLSLSEKDNKRLTKLLSQRFKDHFTGMNIKQNVRIKIRCMAIDIFSIQTLQESINNAKRYNTKDYYLPKGNIKHYTVIVKGKNFGRCLIMNTSKVIID